MNRKKRKWIELHIRIPEGIHNEFSLWLDDQGSIGTIIKEVKGIDDNVIIAYFNLDLDIYRLEQDLKRFLFDYGIDTAYKIGFLEGKDWVGIFKDHFSPFVISDELRIIYPWHKEKKDTDIVIAPEMAFGTGRHESTQLCLYFIIEKRGDFKRVLDIGTGSGILAIASVKFGAEKVIGFEIDEEAIKNCQKNLRLNNITKRQVLIFCGAIDDLSKNVRLRRNEEFDLILCNMLPDNFFPILNRLHNYLKKDTSRLILSGIQVSMRNKVQEYLDRNNFEIVNTKKLNDWIAYEVLSLKFQV